MEGEIEQLKKIQLEMNGKYLHENNLNDQAKEIELKDNLLKEKDKKIYELKNFK